MLIKSIWHPVHLVINCDSQVSPAGEPPLVTAGAPRSALPAKGIMYFLYAATAELTSMQAEPSMQRSGSLNEKSAVEPESMANWAAAGQMDVNSPVGF